MASVRDLAKQTGVSITTVSRVLNNHPNVSSDVRDLVLSAANRTGYVANVGRRATNNIAIIYTGSRSLGSPFDAALVAGVGDALEETEYDLMILELRRTRRPDESYSALCMRKGIRGAVLRATSKTRDVCEAIAAEGFPIIVVGERFEGTAIPFIQTESRTASREAIEYLIGLGHRRIAVCTNVVDDTDHMDRLAGYRDALAAHHIPVNENLIWRVPATREGGPQVIKRVLSATERPTAVYISDPVTCIGTLAEARRAGINIPGDLSVVGFDDGDQRHIVYPTLTAVCQNAFAMGHDAFTMLNTLMAGGPGASVKSQTLRCWLELHDTTGRCGAPPTT